MGRGNGEGAYHSVIFSFLRLSCCKLFPCSMHEAFIAWMLFTKFNLAFQVHQTLQNIFLLADLLGRDSSVSIATRYGLDGPGIESRWGARFSAPVQTGPGAYPASYAMGTVSFPGVKRPGRGVDHPPPSSAEVEGRVELYIYPPLDHRDLL